MRLSIIIPAYNEEKLLPETLRLIRAAMKPLENACELIVVDNESTDRTGEIAMQSGAHIVPEKVHNIGRVRNTGAAAANGEILVFIDADTQVPETLFQKIDDITRDPKCFGGAVAVNYGKFERRSMRLYSRGWEFWGRLFNMKQGAAQFCRKSIFQELGGYDESVYLGEDIEFYWRLTKHAKQNGGTLAFIEEPRVTTSTRRFDKMSILKTLVLTHPIYILFNKKRAKAWKDWYENAVR